jgi:hypothetical protein
MSTEAEYSPDEFACESDEDEHLIRVVVDTCARTFRLYSNEGGEKVVECDTMDEFMNVLTLVRAVVSEDILAYSEARVST